MLFYNYRKKTVKTYLSLTVNFILSFTSVICLDGISSILFILGTRINNDEKQSLLNKLNDSKIKINLWDLDDLSHFFKHIDLPEYNVSLLSEILLNTTVNKSITEDVNTWEKERDRRIEKLNETYLKDDLVLFLGAGISKEAGIPDWSTLISDLLVTMIKEKLKNNKIYINSDEQIEIINSMKQFRHYSPLLQAEYIRTGLGNLFEKELSDIIYDGVDIITKGTSSLLQALARMCAPRRNRIGVRSVITYNFDDLLENHLKEYNILHKTIYKENDCSTVDELPIYHVHGFLPRNPEKYNQLTESLLVFSEEGYHTLYNEPYSWQNIVQLNFLRENTCLMIGLSMTDPNLRRLLSIASKKYEMPKHYVLLKRQLFIETNSDGNTRKDILKTFTVVNQDLQESFFRELGLNVIWFDEYSEIPKILDSIREAQ